LEFCRPVAEWLRENYSPQAKIIIGVYDVKVVESVLGFGLGGLLDKSVSEVEDGSKTA